MVTRGIVINMAGLGATLAGVSALVGMLVAKTLQVRTDTALLGPHDSP
jgi:hypothetical protein